ncbi:MAG: hypothetical protein RR982_01000, partial [Kiritimatiellia bacterium]
MSIAKFWSHTVLFFTASRFADIVNAVNGLWIIPHFLPAALLGAVLPMLSFGGALAVPFSVLLAVFTRTLARYEALGQTAKAQSLTRDAFRFSGIAFLLIFLVSIPLMPWLFRILRVEPSAVGFVAIGYGLIAAFIPVTTAALQATKHFGALSLANLLAAPARILSMLLLLPSLGLLGYFFGQLVPLFVMLAVALFTLYRQRLLVLPVATVSRRLWLEDRREMIGYGLKVLAGTAFGVMGGTIVSFVIRHQLTDDASAAFYLLSRFSEIAAYCSTTVSTVFFPYAVEAHTHGQNLRTLTGKLMLLLFLGGGGIALALYFVLPFLFAALPDYAPYVSTARWAAYLCGTTTLQMVSGLYFSHAHARNDFHYLWYYLPMTVLSALAILTLTDHSLLRVLHILFAAALLQLLCVLVDLFFRKPFINEAKAEAPFPKPFPTVSPKDVPAAASPDRTSSIAT